MGTGMVSRPVLRSASKSARSRWRRAWRSARSARHASTISSTAPAMSSADDMSEVGQLAEVPADDLLRLESQPGVLAVGEERPVRVLVGPQLLRTRGIGIGLVAARYLADDLDVAQQLDAAQLEVAAPGVDGHTHARVAHQVHPALALHDRVQPERRSVPHEPQRRHVRRTVAVDAPEPAHSLRTQEGVELVARHRDPACPLLLPHARRVSDGGGRWQPRGGTVERMAKQSQMQYRRLGNTGVKVSVLSFGSWVTFNTQLDTDLALDCMQAAHDAGCNFFDNAESYAGGKSEEIMGKALAQLGWPRWSYMVTTKFFWGI